MTLAELEQHILSHHEAETDHSFEGDPSVIVFKRSDNKKWFATGKNIGCRYLDIDREGRIDILTVRLSPRVIKTLRTREGFMPAWRAKQTNWVTILLDGTVENEEICDLVAQAYNRADAGARK